MWYWSEVKQRPEQKKFLAEFDRGDTHTVLAERYGVNRSTISAWLKAAGVDPQKNVKRRRAAREKKIVADLRRIRAMQGKRILAMQQLEALAKKYKVRPLTLAHWCEATGHYTPGHKVSLRAGRPRRLPRRRSPQGAALAHEVEAACSPWEPRTIAGLLRQKSQNFTIS